ncbi:MAG TPA: O-antigen ligase family protein, partial [Terriglobales bacterium]|nr:O-antigen ligase family protein [Terriglobales bacterium]
TLFTGARGVHTLTELAVQARQSELPRADNRRYGILKSESAAVWLRRGTYFALLLVAAGAPFAPHFVQFVSRVAFALWLTRAMIYRQLPQRKALFLPFLIFFGIAGLSAIFSYDPLVSWTRLGWFGMGMLILIVPGTIQGGRELKLLVSVLLAAGFISGARTAWQYTAGIGTKLAYVRRDCALAGDGLWSGDMIQEINGQPTRTPMQWKRALQLTRHDAKLKLRVARTYPLQHFYVVIARADLDSWRADPTATLARGTPLRAQGGFYNSIPYAGLMMVLAAVACGLWLSAPSLAGRFALGAVTALFSACLLLTVTRAYIVALLISCLLMVCVGQRRRSMSLVLILLGIAATLVWARETRHLARWYGEEDSSRMMMWSDSPRLILHYPLLGIGWDSVFSHGRRWNLQAYKTYPNKLSHFHSTPIQIAVDAGVLELAVWFWLLAAWFRLLITGLRLTRNKDWLSRGLALGLLGSAAGFVIASTVHYTLGDGEVMGALWLLMGCAVVLGSQVRNEETAFSRRSLAKTGAE